ncbi:FAD-binding protein [Candidatus Woesearchaeota archaeon]|nr:FAD-binding protein [Candidatus Woesearchaeota archaeon]
MLDTVIIGAGIAGCTAAIYASRKRMDFVLLTKSFGGQFYESGEILNYPGIKKTDGADFSKKMKKQLEFNDVEIKEGVTCKGIKKRESYFTVETDKGDHNTKTVIICTGAKPRKLDVSGEKRYAKKGVHYCSVCDGPLYKDKDVAVIGGGDSALEAVDFMSKIAKKIWLVNIRSKLTGHEYLQENLKKMDNVEVINDAETTGISGNKTVSALEYKKKGEKKKISLDGVFIEIGRVPNTGFAENFLQMDEHGHIQIDCATRTSMDGVFAAGDCASGHEYQYVIAAGQGCMALLKAARYLAKKQD